MGEINADEATVKQNAKDAKKLSLTAPPSPLKKF